jgi:tetratricopeptide (TPR) repeat protein
MKTIFNIPKVFLAGAVFAAALVSCSEDTMDEINKDINTPKDAQAKYILSDVITATAVSNVGGDLNTYTSDYVEHEVGTHNQLFRADQRTNEPSAASTFNNTWGRIYISLKDAKIAIAKCSKGGSQEGNDVTKGIAEVLAAYNLALLTDMFGDAPWTEACDWTKYMTPKIDKQADIYKQVMAYIDNAIVDLQKTDAHISGGMGSFDLLYNGNKAKWLKFAYGLKARYTMHLIKRSADKNADLQKVIDYADKSFQSADDQAAFAIYDASNVNPKFDFFWSRWALGASQSMVDKFVERNDPRLHRVFVDDIDHKGIQITGVDDKLFNVAPNGTGEEGQGIYNESMFVYAQTAPTLLLSYHEVLFLKAEALCRLNKANEAEPILKEAVVAGIANAEVGVNAALQSPGVIDYCGGITETSSAITHAEAEAYFENNVKPLFTANPLKETMIQKYIAFFNASGESPECYNDIRRLKALGENFITLNNPNKFPLRCPYGNDDTTANPNVQAAYGDGQYIYTEPVWWAGGTR